MAIRVLFVCMGNICRSPMAEGVFQHLVDQAGLGDKIIVDSAGTSGYHAGQLAHHGTLKVLDAQGIKYSGRSRQLTRRDLNEYDYILAMDEDNLAGIRSLGACNAKVGLFLDYLADQPIREVPDPYYTGGFQQVYDLVLGASRNLLAEIRKEHNL
jgi:protein-tyrosine phosphatase